MRIVAIHERTLPIAAPLRNSAIAFDEMTASALAIVTDASIAGMPLVGFGFDSIGRYGHGGLLRERFIPRLLAAAPATLCDAHGRIDPVRCHAVMMANEKGGGHGERPGAVGLLDAALWDLHAKARRAPLWRVLAERYDTTTTGIIDVYASCGHFRAGADGSELRGEIEQCRASGYAIVKIKVDADAALACARHAVAGSAMGNAGRVALDVNGILDPASMLEWLARVGDQRPAWIEEPVAALDFEALSTFAAASPVPVATGENLFSFDDARNLLRYGGLRRDRDRLQFDVSLSYGVGEFQRTIAEFGRQGWSRRLFWPHAGHLFAAHVVAGFALGAHEIAPDPALVYGGLWDGVKIDRGTVRLPDHPGVGFEAKDNLYRVLEPLAHVAPTG